MTRRSLNDEWQHSAFTKNLLSGLGEWAADGDGSGYITAENKNEISEKDSSVTYLGNENVKTLIRY